MQARHQGSPARLPRDASPAPQHLGHQAQALSRVKMRIPGAQTPAPASEARPSGRRRPPSPTGLGDCLSWRTESPGHTALHPDPPRTELEGIQGMGLPCVSPPVSLPAFTPSCLHHFPPRTPWAHAAPGIHCVMTVNTHNISLAAPTIQMRKLRPKAPSKGQPQSQLFVMSHRTSAGSQKPGSPGRWGATLSHSEKLGRN